MITKLTRDPGGNAVITPIASFFLESNRKKRNTKQIWRKRNFTLTKMF